MYVTTLNHTSSTSTSLYIAFYITAQLTLFDKYITILYATSLCETYCICASSYCILCHCPSSTCFYKYIIILYSSVLGLTSSTNTSPYCTLHHSSGSHYYKQITISYSQPCVTPACHLGPLGDCLPNFSELYNFQSLANREHWTRGRWAVLMASHRSGLTEPLPALAEITWSEKLSHFSVDPHQICHACHHPDPLPGL